MPLSPSFKKTIARCLLLLSAASVLSGCFFEPPGGYEGHRCYQCGEGHYHYERHGDHRDDRGDD